MQLGMIGLGRMGGNMVRRLMANGHECVVIDLNSENVQRLAAEGASGAASMRSSTLHRTSGRSPSTKRLFIGGGNTKKITGSLPENVTLVENVAGLLGGIALWRDQSDPATPSGAAGNQA